MKTIVIVGGGFCGTMAAVHLLSDPQLKVNVVIFDSTPHFGRGVAYAVKSEAFLLNVPAETMGAYPEDPGHFYKWLKQEGYDYQAKDFVPRAIYGNYLEELLSRAGKESGRLQLDKATVRKIERVGEGWVLVLENGERVPADAVLLCTGYPRQSFSFLNPHSQESYREIEKCKAVAIVGSGLTAVDVFEQSRAIGFEGKFFVISRSAKFPHAHGTHAVSARRLETISLIESGQPSLRGLLTSMRSDMTEVGPEELFHQLRPHTVKLWKGLSLKEKRQFFAHLESRWNRVRHRMPQSSAQAIAELQKQDRLETVSGYFQECEQTSDSKFKISYRNRNGVKSLEVDKAFDCRGPSSSIKSHNLVNDLLECGILKLSELGRGVQTTSVGRASSPEQPAFFVCGPLRREELLESTAVRELRQQAFEVSAAMIEELKGKGA